MARTIGQSPGRRPSWPRISLPGPVAEVFKKADPSPPFATIATPARRRRIDGPAPTANASGRPRSARPALRLRKGSAAARSRSTAGPLPLPPNAPWHPVRPVGPSSLAGPSCRNETTYGEKPADKASKYWLFERTAEVGLTLLASSPTTKKHNGIASEVRGQDFALNRFRFRRLPNLGS